MSTGGKVYSKDNDADQTEPDEHAGGWSVLPSADPLAFLAIQDSFADYEQRKAQHQQDVAAAKASAEAKLQALGLTVEELQAIGL